MITIQEKLKNLVENTEQYTQERQNSKWRFRLFTNVTFLFAVLENIPIECPGSFLPEILLRTRSVNCLSSNKDEQLYKCH